MAEHPVREPQQWSAYAIPNPTVLTRTSRMAQEALQDKFGTWIDQTLKAAADEGYEGITFSISCLPHPLRPVGVHRPVLRSYIVAEYRVDAGEKVVDIGFTFNPRAYLKTIVDPINLPP